MKHTLLLAVAYALLGALSLTLALPPDYASPVFPAAGLALSGVLWWGYRVLPGVWLGSLAFQVTHDALQAPLTPGAVAVDLAVATAATLQAATGAWLVRRFQGGAWRTLEREQDAFAFLWLGGGLAGLVSATLSTAALTAAGVVGRAEVVETWWTWYLGDTLGVLVFAPLSLCLLGRREPLWRERSRRILIPMLITLGLVGGGFYGAARWERQSLEGRLAADGAAIARRIGDRLLAHREVLSSLRRFIEALPELRFTQFESFTSMTLEDNPDIFALSFNDLVNGPDRAAFERRAGADAPTGAFQITERDAAGRLVRAGERPRYVAVRYIVPLADNTAALGYDIHSEPVRRAAIERALVSGAMAVTAPIRLVQESAPRVGLLELMPVPAAPGAAADAAPRGFAVAVVKVDEMIAIATRDQVPLGLVFTLTDPAAPPGQALVYRAADGPASPSPSGVPQWQTRLHMGDRQWDLSVAMTRDYLVPHRSWLAWGVGVAGLSFATLLQVLMLGMTGRTAAMQRYRDELEGQVALRARQLADANRFLRTVTDHLPGMVAYWDRDQVCRFANGAYKQWFGRDPAQMLGITARELMGESFYAQNLPNIRAALAGEPQTFERNLDKPDGSTGYVIVHYIPDVRDGAVRGMVVLVTDITEIKTAQFDLERLNRELAEHSRQAEAANRAKSEFLANMSHEIRTPMNAMLGLAQVLERDALAPEQRQMVSRIRSAGRTLLGIINDILDFSKIEAGQVQVETRPFEVLSVLAQIDSLMGRMARTKGLKFRIDTPGGLISRVAGDPLRLEQILVNLVGNAVKFTERGEVVVRVAQREAGPQRVRLRFEVQDTGIGIAPDQLATLGQPFTQGDGSITRRFGGTGLGLAISRHLIDLMGGTFSCDSNPGVGSRFRFELTFARAAQDAVAEAPGEPLPPAGPRLVGLHCLVADDSHMNRDVVERALRREGASATLAADGREALECLRAEPAGFAVVLMDIQMPVMDGLEATRAIREELGARDLPVIAFTAGVLPDQRQAARDAGIDDFLAKPVDLEELVAVLQRWTTPRPSPDLGGDLAVEAGPVAGPGPGRGSGRGWDQPGGLPAPPRDFPAIAGLDTRRAALQLENDWEFFRGLLRDFSVEYADVAGRVREAHGSGEATRAARLLHTLRGTAGNIAALDLMQTAAALENDIKAGREVAPARFEAFAAQLAALLAAAAPWVAEPPAGSATVPAAAVLDPRALAALRGALARHDLAALEIFTGLRPALAAVLGEAELPTLDQAVQDLRFQAALALLAEHFD